MRAAHGRKVQTEPTSIIISVGDSLINSPIFADNVTFLMTVIYNKIAVKESVLTTAHKCKDIGEP